MKDYKDSFLEGNGKKRIGILGGTFDPIHLGHKALGEAALREGQLDKLVIMPTFLQPFKKEKSVTDPSHRVMMAQLCFQDNPKVQVSDFEVKLGRVSYTYDTLMYMKGKEPNSELFFIVGTDAFLTLDNWYKGAELVENFPFMVGVRPGYLISRLHQKISEYEEKYGGRITCFTASLPDISATEIRNRISKNLGAEDLLAKEVERYIYENGLYK